MSTPVTHAFVGLAAAGTAMGPRMPLRLWGLAALCAALPDVDVVGFRVGIAYEHLLGHRGLTHGLPFAAAVSFLAVRLGFRKLPMSSKRWWALWALLFAIAASHGVLDAMTNGGLGVAFFSPFSNARYFLPWRPLVVSPIGLGHFFIRGRLSPWGANVVWSELLWVWAPLLAAFSAATAWRAVRSAGRSAGAAGSASRKASRSVTNDETRMSRP